MKYSAQYHVFPSSFHVLSRKIDFLWDSVQSFLDSLELSSRLQVNVILSSQGFKGKCLLYNRFYCRHSQFVRKHVQQIAVQSCVHFCVEPHRLVFAQYVFNFLRHFNPRKHTALFTILQKTRCIMYILNSLSFLLRQSQTIMLKAGNFIQPNRTFHSYLPHTLYTFLLNQHPYITDFSGIPYVVKSRKILSQISVQCTVQYIQKISQTLRQYNIQRWIKKIVLSENSKTNLFKETV